METETIKVTVRLPMRLVRLTKFRAAIDRKTMADVIAEALEKLPSLKLKDVK